MRKARGSIWANNTKKKGFNQSIGSYEYRGAKKLFGNDRFFVLTSLTTGKTKAYESPDAAMEAGWFIVKIGG